MVDAKIVGQVDGLAKEEVGKDGHGRVGVGGAPPGKVEAKGWSMGWGREGKGRKRVWTEGHGERRVKEGELLRSDQHGEGESTKGELVSEV